MSNAITLSASVREEQGRSTDALRSEGKVPAVLYGFGVENMNITVDRNALVKAHAQAGESVVVQLDVNGTAHPVLIAEVQRNPLNDFFTHVDFRRVDMKKKIEAKIPLRLTGISPAVKDQGGTLVHALEEIEVLCLPDALVHDIEVDVSRLATFDDVIRVSDIHVPAGMEVKTEGAVAVASVQPPRSEAEMAALDAAVETDVSKVEVLSEKKEEPVVEGEAAPEAKAE